MNNPLSNNLMCMGWYMRRTADSHSLCDFYRDVMGLPLMRGGRPWPVSMFWAGEATVFELKSDEAPMPEREQDPETAPCTPIFRVHDVDKLTEKMVQGGAKYISETQLPDARQVHVLDPDGQIIALRETTRSAEGKIDKEAWQRFDDPTSFNPDCDPMPPTIQCLDGVVMRVVDLALMRGFYKNVVGFTELHFDKELCVFDLGDNTFLELRPGGHVVPVPADRVEITNSFILRLQNTDALKQHLKANGVKIVNDHIQWKRAHLAYFADPEGRIIGIEQRYAPEDFLEPVEAYPEDLEAERRYHEGAR